MSALPETAIKQEKDIYNDIKPRDLDLLKQIAEDFPPYNIEEEIEVVDKKVIKEDGNTVRISDLRVGDKIFGDDNTLRTVKHCYTETCHAFKAKIMRNQGYVVFSEQDMLVLKCAIDRGNKNNYYKNRIVQMTMDEYLNASQSFKKNFHLFYTGVTFPEHKIAFCAYLIGMWIANGHMNKPKISTSDTELIELLKKMCPKFGLKVHSEPNNKWVPGSLSIYHTISVSKDVQNPVGKNHFLNALREYDLIGNKHIPHVYKINSRENMLKLIAGLADCDGHHRFYGGASVLIFEQVRKQIVKDFFFMARALGFQTSIVKTIPRKGVYVDGSKVKSSYVVSITGPDLYELPMVVERKKPLFRRSDRVWNLMRISEMLYIGKRKFHRIIVDGNHHYLDSNFMVTHDGTLQRNEEDIFTPTVINNKSPPILLPVIKRQRTD